jgi:NADP-dependent alcohol dehydrogenase
MRNFTFQNTTKLIFGRGTIARLANEIPAGARLMLTFGGGSGRNGDSESAGKPSSSQATEVGAGKIASVKLNGVYDQVVQALKGREYVEFWGIEPNPRVETLRKAVALGKEKNIDFLLAVGGGSVADGTKLIASSIRNAVDPWEIVRNENKLGEVLPFGTVMTLPATGSEMNRGAVISNDATGEKFAFNSRYPEFSILDPETTFSLPDKQIAYGICDTFVHVIEQYLTVAGESPLMDRWAEGIMLTLIETAPKIHADRHNYNAMADYMLSATMGLNGFIAMGVTQDWATHSIGHELTALHGISHGQTLAIVLPALMRVMKRQKLEKILQYGLRVWGISEATSGTSEAGAVENTLATKEQLADAAIDRTEQFFRSLGLATRLCELNVSEETIAEIERRFTERGTILGEGRNIDAAKTKEILFACAK